MSLRLCMIGCGSFARLFHGPAQKLVATRDRGIQLTACCDRDETRAAEYAQTFGFGRHYADLEQMLAAEKPDAVVMAVPPEITCSAASPVLERGFSMLLEKPPGTTPSELARLRALAGRSGARVQVAFNRRHMPVLRRAREILVAAFHDAPANRIEYAMTRFDRWDRDFSTTAVHAVDAVRFLAGSPFRTAFIEREAQTQGERQAMNLDVTVECVSGLRARIAIRPVAGRNEETAVIHGLGQTLKIEIPFPSQPCTDGRLEHWRASERVESFSDEGREVVEKMGIYDETRAFLDAVRAGTVPEPTLADTVQQVELMEALRLCRTGWIDLTV